MAFALPATSPTSMFNCPRAIRSLSGAFTARLFAAPCRFRFLLDRLLRGPGFLLHRLRLRFLRRALLDDEHSRALDFLLRLGDAWQAARPWPCRDRPVT